MNSVLRNEQVCVLDDVLSKEDFAAVWQGLQEEKYNLPIVNGAWHKVWRLTGGFPVWGQMHSGTDYLQPLRTAINTIIKQHPGYVQEGSYFGLTPYIYPPGTKLGWHNDAGYKGALTFYAHPRWGASWGGELMVSTAKEKKECKLRLEHKWEDEYLLKEGHGLYIACKPNRVVLQKSGVWHAINRVDTDAGDNLRVSIQAFWQ